MKTILICIMALSSVSALASSCPQINGIFACTGLDLSNPGKIVKVSSVMSDDGRGMMLRINNNTYMAEGKHGVYCNNDSYRDTSRKVLVIDKDTFEQSFTFENSIGNEESVSSTCVRLR